MADLFDNYEDMGSDIGLDEDGRKVADDRQDWFRLTKGQVARLAFVYFHPIDWNEIARMNSKLKEQGKALLTPEQKLAVAKKALDKRAADLGTTADKLAVIDRLDTSEVKFRQFKGHYQQGLGFIHSRLGMDGPEADQVWKRLEEPKVYITTLVLVYPANSRGDVDVNRISEIQFLPWRFSRQTFIAIWKHNAGLQNNGLSIASQDIKAECTDTNFQKIDISLAGPAVWSRQEPFRRKVLEGAVSLYDKLDPLRHISTEQLRAKLMGGGPVLGGDSLPSLSSGMSTTDYTDVLSELET